MHKLKFILIGMLLLGGMVACGSESDQAVDTITFEELVGTDSLVVDNQMELDTTIDSTLWTLLTPMSVELMDEFDTTALNEFHPFDRFGFNQSEKLEFISKEKVPYGDHLVTPIAEVFVYTFSDSVKLNNAFYNWLDCFGRDCQSVKLNEDLESIKTPPSLTLVYDTTLVHVDYQCEHQRKSWLSFEKALKHQFGDSTRYQIQVSCGGPLKWK